MFLQSRVITVWLYWLIGGVCGVVILLVVICYCRLMPRHQKSIDEQYHKENYKEKYAYSSEDNNYRVKHEEVQVARHSRPASYAGAPAVAAPPTRHASSAGLAEAEAVALKTRSLPSARPEGGAGPRRQRSRMRSEHAALIALSLARERPPDALAPAAVVSDQRTRL